MHVYVLKRILAVVPVLLGLTVIVFAIMALIPGDPAIAILGSYATPENVARLNRDLGLDKPLVQQYFIWLENLLQGDFGRSYSLNRPVLDEVRERFSATLILAGAALVPVHGLGAADRHLDGGPAVRLDGPTPDLHGPSSASPSRPSGSVCLLILLFAVDLRWLPASGMYAVYGGGDLPDLLRHLLLPALNPLGGRRRGHRPADPLRHAGGAAPGLHPHRAREGRLRATGALRPTPSRPRWCRWCR